VAAELIRDQTTRSFLSGWRAWLALSVSLFLLNASVTFENVWPTLKVRWGSAISPELALGVLLIAVAHQWAGWLSRRVLPALWVVLVAGHYLDVTAPGLYGREFNLYWDSQHLGNVAAMLARDVPWWLIATAAGTIVLISYVAFALARLATEQVAAGVQHAPSRRVLGTVAALVAGIWIAQQPWVGLPVVVPFTDPVTPAYARQARYVLATLGPQATAPSLGPSPALDGTLEGLRGADVFLIFVESYGAVAYERPEIAEVVNVGLADFETAIDQTNRQVVSAYVEAPTFGGSSWLAHLSLMSGIEVRDQYTYAALMASERETMITAFSRRGYRTVALMPGMRQAWPEGAFYGFDTIYGRDLLEYEGPQFGWWGIPDQFALAKLEALEGRRPARPPIFVVFPTSTTHAPFGPVAPYQPDWSRVLSADAYEPADVEDAMAARPDLTNLGPSYANAMAYEFVSLAGYLREQRDNRLLIVIGDHQPPAAVSGPGAPWRVPVHVIASRVASSSDVGTARSEDTVRGADDRGADGAVEEGPHAGPHDGILRRLVAHGFQEGLRPKLPSIGAMHELVPIFLDAFDAQE
jgi:hypothetical protein